MQRIGVDAVSVDRIALAVKRSGRGFLDKVYTPAEQAYCAGDDERLAGRWAAKESVIKCFDGTGICFPRRRIEVLPGPKGAPRVRLLGDGRGAQVEVSITHHSRLAVATAHLEISDVATMLPAPDALMIPRRPKDAHKGTFGTAVVLAGSLGLTGAAYLSSTAAARTGAGLVRLLALHAKCPLVIDADGLNALADSPRSKGKLGKNRVLTPHPGELSRLTGKTAEAINADRAGAARKAAKEWGAIVVLKGAHTVVAHPDGRVSEDPHEVPALASGGTGDVLSGIIGGLIAQGSDPFSAAVTGVYVHAAAGARIAQRLGDSGLLAGDLLPEIPLVMNVLRQGGL